MLTMLTAYGAEFRQDVIVLRRDWLVRMVGREDEIRCPKVEPTIGNYEAAQIPSGSNSSSRYLGLVSARQNVVPCA